MTQTGWLAERFEENRRHLRKVAYRILGTPEEADDALQEAWVRLSRADADSVENLKGWLTTSVARVCLDMLRARRARGRVTSREESSDAAHPPPSPEAELLLADSVGPALLIVLETLEPAERVAFVLHDMFDLPFDDVAQIVGRSVEAARQLASRARRKVQGDKAPPAADLSRHREVVQAFLAASRDGDFEALLNVLDPEIVVRADPLAVATAVANKWSVPAELRGARAVAAAFNGRARGLLPATIDGAPGALWAFGEQTRAAWVFRIEGERIAELNLVMEPAHLARLDIVQG